MRRRDLLLTLSATAFAQTPRRPNIVLLLADDLGYGDLACYGQKQILTPNLDALAAQGMRFTQAYAGSTVCAPSRCCLFTGKHTGHGHIRGNMPTAVDLSLRAEDVTIPEVLRRAGYRTGIFGKWALGQLGTPGYTLDKGFDESATFFSQTAAHNYYPEHIASGRQVQLMKGNMGTQKQDYAPDYLTQRALDFVKNTPAAQPFFLYWPTTIPHANNEMGRDTGNGMEVPNDAPYTAKPWPQVEKNFAAMVTRLDADLGKLQTVLKQTGRDQDTLILFSSDNGPHREGGHDPNFFDSNGPLRGIKRDLYEGGIRVPFLAHWPGKIQPGVSDQPIAFWDLLPTLAEVAGQPAPAGIDGLSVLPTLLGRGVQRQHDYFYWEFHERGFAQAIRQKQWKGIRQSGKSEIELYDLSRDLGETKNLASEQPEMARKLLTLMTLARTESKEFPIKA
ncbi:MAG: arylsulfatase [Bryobacteraceae bacterium]|nr:arylsulfatase [Bryobacteraceae bacterium]